MGGIQRDQIVRPGADSLATSKGPMMLGVSAAGSASLRGAGHTSVLGPSLRAPAAAVSSGTAVAPMSAVSTDLKSRAMPATILSSKSAALPSRTVLPQPHQMTPVPGLSSPTLTLPRNSPRGVLTSAMSSFGASTGMAESLGLVSSDTRTTSAGKSSDASAARAGRNESAGSGPTMQRDGLEAARAGSQGPDPARARSPGPEAGRARSPAPPGGGLADGAPPAIQLPPQVCTDVPGPDPTAWILAARKFPMNSDFDIFPALAGRTLPLEAVMELMKVESADKWTIQALGDKITLHKMVRNLGIPQMPAFLIVEGPEVNRPQVEACVKNYLFGPAAHHIVVKPSHMSNVEGVIFVSPASKDQEPARIADVIEQHMVKFLAKQASQNESAALRSLRPGFIVQPKYESFETYPVPLELRVVVLWGKARVAVWWWGRHGAPNSHPERNVWLVRQPAWEGELSDEDTWEIVHLNPNPDAAFEAALETFEKNIVILAKMAEVVAYAVGAPFLRSDFFVGSPHWGVRLNEVAYGSGIDYFTLADDGSDRIVNDGPMIARILQEGMENCQKRTKPAHFLSTLGVQGPNYASMFVVPSNDILGQETALAQNIRGQPQAAQGLLPLTQPRRQQSRRQSVAAPTGGLEISSLWNQGHFFPASPHDVPNLPAPAFAPSHLPAPAAAPHHGLFDVSGDQVSSQADIELGASTGLPPQASEEDLSKPRNTTPNKSSAWESGFSKLTSPTAAHRELESYSLERQISTGSGLDFDDSLTSWDEPQSAPTWDAKLKKMLLEGRLRPTTLPACRSSRGKDRGERHSVDSGDRSAPWSWQGSGGPGQPPPLKGPFQQGGSIAVSVAGGRSSLDANGEGENVGVRLGRVRYANASKQKDREAQVLRDGGALHVSSNSLTSPAPQSSTLFDRVWPGQSTSELPVLGQSTSELSVLGMQGCAVIEHPNSPGRAPMGFAPRERSGAANQPVILGFRPQGATTAITPQSKCNTHREVWEGSASKLSDTDWTFRPQRVHPGRRPSMQARQRN